MAEPLPGINGLRSGETPLVPAGESLRLRVAPTVAASVLDSCRIVDAQTTAMACVVAPASGDDIARRALEPEVPTRDSRPAHRPRAIAVTVTGPHAGAAPMLDGTILDDRNVGPVSSYYLRRGGDREVILVDPAQAERALIAAFRENQAQFTRLETVRQTFNAHARHRGQPEFSQHDWYTLLARSRMALEGNSPQLLGGQRVFVALTQAELFAVFEHAVLIAARDNPGQFRDPERAIEFGRSILVSNVGEELQRAYPGRTITAEQVARHLSATAAELARDQAQGRLPASMAGMSLPSQQETYAFVKRQQKAGIVRFDGQGAVGARATVGGELITAPRLAQVVAGERERRLGEARTAQARAQFTRALNLEQLQADAVEAAYERVILRRHEVVTAERDLQTREDGTPRRFRLPTYT